MSETNTALTVQSPGKDVTLFGGGASIFNWTVEGDYEHVPAYGNRSRDAYLVKHLVKYGNDLLAGAVSILQSKIVTTHWFVEGPLPWPRGQGTCSCTKATLVWGGSL